MQLLATTRTGRDVNRHHYQHAEIDEALRRPVVRSLGNLIRFRTTHPAFDGEFTVSGGGTGLVATWTAGEGVASLDVDLATGAATVEWTAAVIRHRTPLANLPAPHAPEPQLA